jgi:long-chain acyl-CoA synthetase
MDTIGENMKEVNPNLFCTVPRLLEKVYDKIVAKGQELTGIKRSLFFWALALGQKYELNTDLGFWYNFQLKLANKIIFNKWREALGGNVKFIVSGGAALQPRLARVFSAAQIVVMEGYGLTETSAACMSVPWQSIAPTDEEFGVVSTGRMLDGFAIRILDDERNDVAAGELGEIAISGRGVFSGYWQRPAVNAESFVDGYFLTGDIGSVRDGWIYVLDRKKELINASGFKVSPREVEDVLYRHPAVREAGVTAMPDDYRGEAVLAVISLRTGETVDIDEVRAFVRERLAVYKVPAHVLVVDELPKNTNGKILRRELAALAVRE